MLILVVEDEHLVARFIRKGLEASGYQVEVVDTGGEALGRIRAERREYALVLLDLGLPDRSGFEVLAEIRSMDQTLPVIMLTAKSDVPSRVRGLDLGADDYLPKPFDFEELLARIRARLRDTRQPQADAVSAGGLTLDLRTREVVRDGSLVDLTPREFALLEFLMRHEGQVLSRVQILNAVWGYDFDPTSNVVDVYVGYLRSKLGDREGEVIETVRGGGYRLRRPGSDR